MSTTAVDLTIVDAGFLASHPELHHYTTRRGLEGIVRSNTLWAMRHRDLNDTTEVVHLRDDMAKAVGARFEVIARGGSLRGPARQLVHQAGGPKVLARNLDHMFA